MATKTLPRDDDDRLFDREEAAEFLGLSVNTLAFWAMHQRHLPVVRLGRRVKYRLADLRAYITKATCPAHTPRDAA